MYTYLILGKLEVKSFTSLYYYIAQHIATT